MVTETCPRCRSRALVAEGYRDPKMDAVVTRAVCTGCGLTWDPELETPSELESAHRPMAY